jgi:general secretion pathway protein A
MDADIYAALGMKANPFPPGACKDPYYFTESAKRILDELHYGVAARKGFLLVIGEVGLGKTSLLLQFLPLLEKGELEVSWVFNTVLDKVELLGAVAKDFGLRIPRAANLTEIIDHLHQFFLKQAQNNKNCAIVIDEAHHLDNDTLELLRMLSNLELEGDKLVQILLVGQPELMTRLWSQELRQLRSRINIFIELPPPFQRRNRQLRQLQAFHSRIPTEAGRQSSGAGVDRVQGQFPDDQPDHGKNASCRHSLQRRPDQPASGQ